MAKIPRIERGNRPSGIPGGRIDAGMGDSGAQVFNALGNAADVGYKIAAGEEAREAERLQAIMDARQKIENEVSAGRIAVEFETSDADLRAKLQKDFLGNPSAAVEAYKTEAFKRAEDLQKQAPNMDVGLQVARDMHNQIQTSAGAMANWAIMAQTQNIKINLDGTLLQMAANTGRLDIVASPGALKGHLERQKAKLLPQLRSAYGEGAADRWKEAARDAVKRHFTIYGEKYGPLAIDALNRGGVWDEYLSGDDVKSLKSHAVNAANGAATIAFNERIVEAFPAVQEAYEKVQSGSMSGEEMLSRRLVVNEKIAALKSDPEVETNKIKAEGLRLAEVERDALTGIDRLRLLKTPANPVEDLSRQNAIIARHRELLPKLRGVPKSKDFMDLMAHQIDIMSAQNDGALPPDQARTLMAAVAEQLEPALVEARRNVGFDIPFIPGDSRDAFETGSYTIRNLVNSGRGRKLSPEAQNQIYMKWAEKFVRARADGNAVSDAQSEKFAREAAAAVMQQSVPKDK